MKRRDCWRTVPHLVAFCYAKARGTRGGITWREQAPPRTPRSTIISHGRSVVTAVSSNQNGSRLSLHRTVQSIFGAVTSTYPAPFGHKR
jgi:hypothetical protein